LWLVELTAFNLVFIFEVDLSQGIDVCLQASGHIVKYFLKCHLADILQVLSNFMSSQEVLIKRGVIEHFDKMMLENKKIKLNDLVM